MVEETYSAGLISQSFWFVEMKKVIKLIDDGKSEEEIKKMCIDENLFGTAKEYRAKRIYGYIWNRAKRLDKTLLDLFCTSDLATQKVINLITILRSDRLRLLVYMPRWNADTIGNVRVEYLHRIQRVYEKEIIRMQEIIDNSHDNKEISNATKRKEKLQKQIKETKDYDAHLALSRIDIDLDDGVKVNYEKVQTTDGKKMQILAKI